MSQRNHEFFMWRCLQLASNGLGKTYPNPVVGSVIVLDGKIIGEGWHQKAGEAHAEVNAINSVADKGVLERSTIYVSLEPCSHYGKTPPCSDLIVRMGIKNVVVGTLDYNSEVNGKGISHLRKNGCNVTVGVLEKQCREINKRFFTFHQKKRPYIVLKWAQSQDGFIYPENKGGKNSKPIWISNIYSLQLVHKWRTEEQSILVGTNTAIVDNPRLNARDYYGKDPLRLVIDKDLKIGKEYFLLDDSVPTIVFTRLEREDLENTVYRMINFDENVPGQICDYLFHEDIQSLFIEGGSMVLQSFIDAGLWDEARIFESNIHFLNGIKAPELPKEKANKITYQIGETQINDNKLLILKND